MDSDRSQRAVWVGGVDGSNVDGGDEACCWVDALDQSSSRRGSVDQVRSGFDRLLLDGNIDRYSSISSGSF